MRHIILLLCTILITACTFEEALLTEVERTRASKVCINNGGVDSYTSAGMTLREVICKNGARFKEWTWKDK